MEITCFQMDVLLGFYIEGDLSKTLRKKVEEHMQKCPACRAKYNIISSLYEDLQDSVYDEEKFKTRVAPSSNNSEEPLIFKNKLSAYIDNELPQEENIKIKKYVINNKTARKNIEDACRIRKLMNDSFKKTKSESKADFSKKILKQLDICDENYLTFSPIIKVGFAFVMTVFVISAIIIFSITMG